MGLRIRKLILVAFAAASLGLMATSCVWAPFDDDYYGGHHGHHGYSHHDHGDHHHGGGHHHH